MKKNFSKVAILVLLVTSIGGISSSINKNNELENLQNDYEALANEESFKDDYYTDAIANLQERNDNQVKIIEELQK